MQIVPGLYFFAMRYFYEKPEEAKDHSIYFKRVNHPLYNSCRLYMISEEEGLAIIQKRFNSKLKVFFYSAPDSWIMDEILKCSGFVDYTFKHAGECKDGIFPTVTVRQVMYALKMKPLKKEWWESQDFRVL